MTQFGNRTRWQTVKLGLLSAVLAVGGSGAIVYALVTAQTPPPQPTVAQAGTLAPAGAGHLSSDAASRGMPASLPVRLRIPSIDVDAAVGALGTNADGSVQVPTVPDDAGWYTGSADPGQIGAAVLLGHVDFSRTGPAVFYRLGELKPGASVLVARKDGSTAAFTVDAVREYPKSNFPTDEVYGPTTDDSVQLRLITCGSWDTDQHKYVGNTVVFATLTRPGSAVPSTSAAPSASATTTSAPPSASSAAPSVAASAATAAPPSPALPPSARPSAPPSHARHQ